MTENEKELTKCPKCGEPLEYLNNSQEVTKFWEYHGNGDYEGGDDSFADGCGEYECPNCYEILATDEDEADRILGKK